MGINMKIYDRKSRNYFDEIEYEKNKLKFLYNTVIGRILLKIIIAKPIFSKIRSRYYKSERSKKDIIPFINKYNINIQDFNIHSFKSFNEFFIRKRSDIVWKSSKHDIISPCEARLQVYKLDDRFKIKGIDYRLRDVLNRRYDLKKFKGGKVLVFRLAANDYHRFIYIDSGEVLKKYNVKGVLHTVRPIAKDFKAYKNNCRNITIMRLNNIGYTIEIDIGALLIGHIVDWEKTKFNRYDEKGYFEYGGSTIVLVVNKNCVIDKDILDQSKLGFEVKVDIGDKIGEIRLE